METDDCSTSDHDHPLLCYLRTIYRFTNWSSGLTFLYGIHCSRTRDDVDNYELFFSCSVIFLYGKIPENYRRDISFTNSILGDHIRIHHRRSDPRHDNRYHCTHSSDVFYSCVICAYVTHDIICIFDFTPLCTRMTPELTHCG